MKSVHKKNKKSTSQRKRSSRDGMSKMDECDVGFTVKRDELELEWMAVTHRDVRRDSLRRLCFQLNYWMSIWSQLPEGLRQQYTWSEHFPALLPRRLSVDRWRIRTQKKRRNGKTIFMRIFAIIEIMMDISISISANEQWLFSKLR